jgi:hypothetical protein
MSGNRCVKGKEDYAVLLPFAGTLGMSEGGRSYSFTRIVWRSSILAVNGRNGAYTGTLSVKLL